MDTKKLRQKILDLAIRGKLVPQDPNDEPASVLLERIREEKKQMVKDGKLKAKDIKNDTIIFKGDDNLHYEKFQDGTVKCIEDEIPFEVPKGWEWCRLECICPYGETESVGSSIIEDDAWILDLEDIEKETGRIIYYATKNERDSKSNKHRFIAGQLLYSKLRPYLNKVVIAQKDGFCTSEILPLKLYGDIRPEYIQCYLMSNVFLAYVNLISYGLKMPRLGTNDGKRAVIALPPISEQIRIYQKCYRAFDVIDTLQSEKEYFEELITSTKNKILDMAIHGKLVPQDPNDEPASALLERIRAEKEELIKQGKLKRDKKESIIYKGDDNSYYMTDDNKAIQPPFEIPDSWTWSNLRELCNYGDCENVSPEKIPDDAWVLDLEDIEKDTGMITQRVLNIDRKTSSTKHSFKKGMILYSKLRPYLNKVVLTDSDGYCTSEIIPLKFEVIIHPRYAQLFLMSNYFVEYANSCSYGMKMPRLGTKDGQNALFAIPPYSEQIRIANMADKLYKIIHSISEAI